VSYTSDWTGLAALLSGLVSSTCQDFTTNPCGSCNGFCSCDKTCICPDCDARDKCQVGSCSTSAFGSGCVYSSLNCDDSNACTVDSCNSSTGCTHTNYSCPVKPCYTSTCLPSVGCVYAPLVCDTGDICTNSTCDPNSNTCIQTPRPCDRCKNECMFIQSTSNNSSP
jgi:hypothetical protein